MDHQTFWKHAKPIEPEQTRHVGTYDLLPLPLPEYLFAVPNGDGSFEVFVTRPPDLPRSKFVVTLAPYKVCNVQHCGTQECPVEHLRAIIEHPHLSELFIGAHEVSFVHITTEGIREMNDLELAGYQQAVDATSPLSPRAFWTLQAAMRVLGGTHG